MLIGSNHTKLEIYGLPVANLLHIVIILIFLSLIWLNWTNISSKFHILPIFSNCGLLTYGSFTCSRDVYNFTSENSLFTAPLVR